MLTTGGQVKILDLGLALLAVDARAPTNSSPTGRIMGTADYMAPEQAGDTPRRRHPRRHLQPRLHALQAPYRQSAL